MASTQKDLNSSMFNNPLYSDILIRHTYRGVTKQYHAHKAILSAGSPWFLNVLTQIHNGMEPIDISEDDDPEHFEVALRFLYTHKIDAVMLQEASRLNDNHGDLSSSDKPTHRHKHDSSGLLMERKLYTLLSIHSLADKYEIEGLQASLSQYMPGQRELCAAWLSRYSSHLQQFVQEHYCACIDKDCMMGRRVCSMVLHFGSKRFVKDPVFDDLIAQYPKFCTDMFREACDDDRILFGTRENLNMPVNSTSMLVHEKD